MTTRDTPFCVTWFGKLPSVAAATATFLFALSSIGASAQSTPNYVGFWWKPSESGWGMSIQQQGARTYAVWFTYDTQSAPIWHALDCAFAGNTCAGDLYTATGTPLSQITGSANHVPSKSGTGSITVTSPNRLSLAYAIGAVTQTKTNLEPQNFTAADQVPACTLQTPTGTSFRAGLSNYTDHWWGGPNAAGWGVQISHQGNQVFAGWYSYNQQGTATWLTAQGSQDANNARRFTGSLYQVNPGIPFSIINGPIAQSSIASVGTFEFNFVDGERGTFTYSLPAFGIVARSLAIERFAIAGGAVNVCTVAGSSTTTPWTKYFGAHYTNTPNASGLTRNWAGGGLRYPGGNGSQYRPALSGATYVDEAASSFTSIALPLINTLLGDGKYAVLGAGPPGALFLDSMTTASGRDAYKKSITSRIDQIAALTNGRGWEKKIYFQFGNEISNSASTGFYGALCLWVTRNTPTPVANCDLVTQFIPTYVEYYLAPGAAHLEEKSQALFGRPDALHAMTGSIVNLSNREVFLDSLLNYRIVGTYAPAYAGRRVSDIVDTVSIHYTVTTPTWRTALDTFRSKYLPGGVPTTRVRALWTTEEGGVRSAEQGYGMATALRGIARYLSWWQANNVTPDDAHAFYWGSEIGNASGGTSLDQDMPLLHNFVGDRALTEVLQNKSAFGVTGNFESYEYAVNGQDKRVLIGFVPSNTDSATLSSLTLNLSSWAGRNVSVSAYRLSTQGPQALVVTPNTLVAGASVAVNVSTTLTDFDAVLFLVRAE